MFIWVGCVSNEIHPNHIITVLSPLLQEVPIGTNLARLHFFWMLISGALLPKRIALPHAFERVHPKDTREARLWEERLKTVKEGLGEDEIAVVAGCVWVSPVRVKVAVAAPHREEWVGHREADADNHKLQS